MIETAVTSALAAGPVDLIVFPEYTGVFLALVPHGGRIANATGFEGFRDWLLSYAGVSSPRDYFLSRSTEVEERLGSLFGSMAVQHGVSILGGSYFARGPHGELRNRAVVYDPSGSVTYKQDKVFLTEFERVILGIQSGSLTQASGFQVGEWSVGLTICRDTFFAEWESVQASHHVWIDIKANGTLFTETERESFLRALPARVAASGVPHGITVCLTGRIMDLVWEGVSSHVEGTGDGVRFLQTASSPDQQEVLRLEIPPPAGLK